MLVPSLTRTRQEGMRVLASFPCHRRRSGTQGFRARFVLHLVFSCNTNADGTVSFSHSAHYHYHHQYNTTTDITTNSTTTITLLQKPEQNFPLRQTLRSRGGSQDTPTHFRLAI
ncbi:hypothetical protein E2C01_044140 [Portunus trituberculatus]|uniref:Uncharacterized protein n=1 Tax=Portunus trituberculatus TaxID=210409 RepID=A0A5B7FYA4_PORTR|nr:hypothetical protein [Portunus trituberculatus]